VDDDGSIILGTQKDNENSVFRQPRIPQQCRSTSINKNNTSMNESKASQIAITLHKSNINISENQVSIHDVETQKFEEGYKMASNSIYDMETQGDLIDIAEHIVEANIKTGKQLPKVNVHDKTTGKSMTDIHDIETQNCIDDINEMETQKINIQNVTGKKFTTDIHIVMETQKTNDTEEGSNDAEKSEIDKNNIQEKSLARIGQDIHNLETQKLDNKYIAEDISDLETQLELDSIARCKNRDISDMETQFVTDMTNETSNDRVNKDKDKNDIIDITKNGIDQENAKSSKSRSSSPSSLNLSSPGVEDCPSPLNQSSHLLESSDLLEFFSEGIDKQEVQASNMSTPKSLTKVSSDRSSNVENVQTMVNNEEDNDEDIFEAPTQRVSCNFEALMSDNSETDEENALIMCKVPKKKHRKSQLEQTNNDSETDAEEYVTELAKKQCKSSKILNNPSNEDINDKNDPGTSIESEDMFDVQTQRLNNSTIKDTSNSSINQPQNTNKINETEVDDVASTQTVNNVDQDNQTSASTSNINDMASTLVLSHETPKTVINSKDFASKNQNDLDDMTNTHIINAKSVDCCTIENLDREDTDYELAPTQLIGEIESRKEGNSTCERSASEVNLNDTLEQKLNEMFDDVNNDTNSIYESPHMSTQYLENILESSQCDASANKSIVDNRDTTDSMPQKQAEKKNDAFCNQHSHNLDIEINTNNVNKEKNDSQNSDVYFSTITTRRKRNILRDTQEVADSMEDTTPHDINFSQASKADNEKNRLVNDNTAVESNKKRKRISKTKNKSYGITETLNDNNKNKTLSSENTERSLRSSKSMKQKDEAASNKQVLRNPVKVDDAEENTSICTPCPSGNGQRAQTLDTLYESDDDILTRLPAVRISGTLSNPASPSASSTSTVRSTKSKQDFVKNKEKKGISLGKKSRDIRNFDKNTKPSADSHSNSVFDSLTSDKISGFVDTSDDSDSETNDYKRFQQLADRMLSKKLSYPKQQNKRKSAHVSRNVSEDPKKNMDVELKNPGRTSSRITRHSSRQSDESSHDFQKEACVKNTAYGVSIDPIDSKSMESEMKSAVAKRKTSLNIVIEENTEQVTSKKRKTAQIEKCRVFTRSQRNTMKITTDPWQSPKILEHFTKMSSHVSSPENMKSFEDNKTVSKTLVEETQKTSLNTRTDGNVDPGRINIKRTRNKRIIYDSQATTNINDVTANENSKKNKLAETKGTEIRASQTRDKVLKILLSPIKNLADDESQEVERIMARGPSNTQDKNLSIRESKAKIFERELRTRSRKRQNSDTETDSVLTESSTSSVIEDSDNMQLDNSASKAKRERLAKNSVFSLPEAQVLIKKEIFKKPTRINQNSTSSILDSSTENTGESSQSSMESDASTNSRLSRSKTARSRKKEKMESNQSRLINESTSRLNINVEITSPVSTPSRTRRSTSVLNNSTPSAIKHKILFTGITEDHSKIVKMLGEYKF